MSAAAGAASVSVIAIIEEYFKKYLIICEHLRLDPRVIHEPHEIEERCERLLERVDVLKDRNGQALTDKKKKKLYKDLKWFIKYYLKLAQNKLTSYGFAKKCEKLALKGKLTINEQTVSSDVAEHELTRIMYDSYSLGQRKYVFIAIGVTILAFVAVGVIVAILL